MAFGYSPPYPNIYQPQMYPQMVQAPQNQMMQNPQQIPMQNQPVQPMQQIQPIPASAPQQSNGMIWISGKAEADNWPVLPGNAVALWDSNAPTVYLRQADSTGKPSTKVYDLVERVENQTVQAHASQVDLSRYLTIDAAEGIIERRINDILAERLKRPSKATKTKEDTEDA